MSAPKTLESGHLEAADAHLHDYEIVAHSSLAGLPPKVLKDGDVFAVLDCDGDCGKSSSVEGVYHRDMRHLSRWRVTIHRHPLLLLSSVVHDDNAALSVSQTNPDIQSERLALTRDAIAVTRTKFVTEAGCYERIALRNYDRSPHRISLEVSYGADFLDLFEVRGLKRNGRGRVQHKAAHSSIAFTYLGLDGVRRETRIAFDVRPVSLTASQARFDLTLPPHGATSIVGTVHFFAHGDRPVSFPSFRVAYRDKLRAMRAKVAAIAKVSSSNNLFNEAMTRATSDIGMLLSRTAEDGFYPHAGIPWYSTVFGRDGLITALLMLWAAPDIARGVLLYLASRQATEIDIDRDAQPGKILHEERLCETARTGEVPFAAYYGTVDATPLFVMLAGRYFKRTGDDDTLRRIWPNLRAAMEWCCRYGDRDGDGFIEYLRETPNGLANQGWKDSHDSVFHADGRLADGPIALVEVQAYYYEALRQAAFMAKHLGHDGLSEHWRSASERLKSNFDAAFWNDRIGSYALALDGAKRPCVVRTSNAGHVLLTNMAPLDKARRAANTLMAADMFCRWGVRTVSSEAPRFNPMSYHNGSVWPHDNALIGLGFANIGLKTHVAALFDGLFAAHTYQADRRLPELFCGFKRKPGRGPVGYPVSCIPQAWAAASSFGLLGACLGLSINSARNLVDFNNPILPPFLDKVRLSNVRVNSSTLDLELRRDGETVALELLDRSGDADASVTLGQPNAHP
jgi:glycogen debranching enzyme